MPMIAQYATSAPPIIVQSMIAFETFQTRSCDHANNSLLHCREVRLPMASDFERAHPAKVLLPFGVVVETNRAKRKRGEYVRCSQVSLARHTCGRVDMRVRRSRSRAATNATELVSQSRQNGFSAALLWRKINVV